MIERLRCSPRFLRLESDEELPFDDALLDAYEHYRDAPLWKDLATGLYDARLGAAALEPLFAQTFGRPATWWLEIEGLIPLDWAVLAPRDLDAALGALPGARPLRPGPYLYYGEAVGRVPVLWASHEAPGLHVFGHLDEARWAAWRIAFERATAGWPLR